MTPITDIDEQLRNEENTKQKYITPEIIEFVRTRQEIGVRVVGPEDVELKTIKILR